MPTNIQWTDETWNPVTGCNRVSPGCDNCYMFQSWPRWRGMGTDGYQGEPDVVSLNYSRLETPLRWKKPRRVFVCSMADLFNSSVPFEYITQVFSTMARVPHITFQVLTKRPGRMAYFANEVWPNVSKYRCRRCKHVWYGSGPFDPCLTGCAKCGTTDFITLPNPGWPSNVWAGTSVESQKYTPRLDCLAKIPAPVRFVSYEPALGPVDFSNWLPCLDCKDGPHDDHQEQSEEGSLHWVIAGGERGSNAQARPADSDWFRSVRDQCLAADVPFFFKQWGTRAGESKSLIAELDNRPWAQFPTDHFRPISA